MKRSALYLYKQQSQINFLSQPQNQNDEAFKRTVGIIENFKRI